jgi:hypothetical protein
MNKQHKVTKQQPTQAPQEPAQGTPPAPAATQGAAPVNAAMQVIYKAGKPYNVRPGTAQDNARSWDALQKVLTEKGGQATRADLVAAVTPFNHAPFVGYAIRRGWLTVVAPATQAA